MTFYIDTTDFNTITYGVAPKASAAAHVQTYRVDSHSSHKTLSLMEKFLTSAKIKTGLIKKIVVNKGPGSFTGTRIGIAHAMALGLAWGVPVKAVDKKKFIIR